MRMNANADAGAGGAAGGNADAMRETDTERDPGAGQDSSAGRAAGDAARSASGDGFRASAGITDRWRHFRFAVDAGVATLTLSRPDRLNALTFEVYADLRDLFVELPHRGDVRALVLTGEGRGFCSGGDVEEIIEALLDADERRVLEFTRMTGAVVRAMRECPVPIVAAVNGTAAGAGAVIALAADFRLLAASARFAFLFTKVGLAGADMGAAYLLPRIVGFGRATELLMLGDTIEAATAERIGLAGRVVPDADLAAAAAKLARRIADGPTQAYANTKMLLTRELDMDLGGAIELEATTQALLMRGADHAEFARAYRERREPRWTGR
jgi:enoyl-CoA hydratase/carnithine racemase